MAGVYAGADHGLQATRFKLREWYCAKEIEPEGGFKSGEQRGFCGTGTQED